MAEGGVGTEGVGFVEVIEGEGLEGLPVAGEVREEVPAHGVDVGAGYFVGELRVVGGEEAVEVFVFEEGLLLDHLGVYRGGAEGFDLGDEVVADSF